MLFCILRKKHWGWRSMAASCSPPSLQAEGAAAPTVPFCRAGGTSGLCSASANRAEKVGWEANSGNSINSPQWGQEALGPALLWAPIEAQLCPGSSSPTAGGSHCFVSTAGTHWSHPRPCPWGLAHPDQHVPMEVPLCIQAATWLCGLWCWGGMKDAR